MPHQTDGKYEEADLIARARRFEPKAISQLYQMYADGIYKYAYARVSDTHVAEDITSDVFLRALEGLESYEYRGIPFSAWLYRIARGRVVDHYRRTSRRQTTVTLNDSIVAAQETPDRAVLRGLDAEELRDAMDVLTEDQRLVTVMRFLEGKSLAEVAHQLGKTEGSIKALQHRALAALSRVLGGKRH